MILVTGATGFLGRALYKRLSKCSPLRVSVRDKSKTELFTYADIFEASLSPIQDWSIALSGVAVVVHCAARVHVMKDGVSDPLSEYRRVNVEGTLNLARQAAEAGVRRFIFISSIKVNGDYTNLGCKFTADQTPVPMDPYGISKYEAEIGLRTLSELTGMEVVIIRPPLVYGPGVKANFLSMMNWMRRRIPLPFGGITKNRRSLVFIGNLVDFIVTCINHQAAANHVFLVSDGEDLSTAELLIRTSLALGMPPKLMSIPEGLVLLAARIVGRPDIFQRLCGSLQIDLKKSKDLLGWCPPFNVDEGLHQTAERFLNIDS